MQRKTLRNKRISIEAYSHAGRKRTNNPPVGLVSGETDKLNGIVKYAHDPHIDPYLSWAGKIEGNEVNVQNVSLHIHERIDPKRIIKSFLKKDTGPKQVSLFEQPKIKSDVVKIIVDGIDVNTLKPECFIKAYTFSSTDGYRIEKRGNSDLNIVQKLRDLK